MTPVMTFWDLMQCALCTGSDLLYRIEWTDSDFVLRLAISVSLL